MTISTEFMVADVLEMIREDVRTGEVDPTPVTTFADLHDQVDANMYVVDAIDAAGQNDPAIAALVLPSDPYFDLANRIMDEVSAAIKNGALK